MKTISLILSITFAINASASDLETRGNIRRVTVYAIGAEVAHELNVKIPAGQNTLIVKGVSQFALKTSVIIPDPEITVINAELVKKLTKKEVDELNDEIVILEQQVKALEGHLSAPQTYTKSDVLADLMLFHEKKMLSLKRRIRDLQEKLERDSKNTGEPYLMVLISTNKEIERSFEMRYVVGSAAWAPSYEIYVEDYTKPMELKYIAKIMNKTGEDWNNVEINLSLNSPFDKAGDIPRITPLFVKSTGFQREIETTTMPGRRSLSEDLATLKIEGVEYEEYQAPVYNELIPAGKGLSVPANGGLYNFQVFTKPLQSKYVWYAFPSIEKNPYLICKVSDWKSMPIIDGNARVFYKGTNIGDTYISINGIPDTLEIPVGQNQEMVVERKFMAAESGQKESGNKVKITNAYQYTVRSTAPAGMEMYIFDQVPVSLSNHITVEVTDKSGAEMDDDTGLLSWMYVSGKEPNIKLKYSIEYAKNKVKGTSNNFYRQDYSRMDTKKVRAKF